MGIMNSARQLDDELRRASIRYWLALDNFVEWSAFHELHAEVAGTVTFSDLVNRDDGRVVQARCGFRLKAKPFNVRCRSPSSEADDF